MACKSGGTKGTKGIILQEFFLYMLKRGHKLITHTWSTNMRTFDISSTWCMFIMNRNGIFPANV